MKYKLVSFVLASDREWVELRLAFENGFYFFEHCWHKGNSLRAASDRENMALSFGVHVSIVKLFVQ